MADGFGTTTAAADNDLWAAAERLRAVRQAHARFLALWAVDRLLDDPAAAARCRADVDATPDNHADVEAVERPWFSARRLDD